jgi:DnaJ-class molecular chaperone
MDGKYCEKDKTALIRCSECDGTGKEHGHRCTKCKGTGYLCQAHGANWQK